MWRSLHHSSTVFFSDSFPQSPLFPSVDICLNQSGYYYYKDLFKFAQTDDSSIFKNKLSLHGFRHERSSRQGDKEKDSKFKIPPPPGKAVLMLMILYWELQVSDLSKGRSRRRGVSSIISQLGFLSLYFSFLPSPVFTSGKL